jgi:hypothetical protein
MANLWVRLWNDMPNDPKWRTIARASKQSISTVIAIYVHMLVCASNNANANERGRTLSWCDEDIASALDIETHNVIAVREAMQGRVLKEDYLTGWEKRQPIKEDGASERSKLWRLNKKNESERERTQPNASERPDKETDKDTDKDLKENIVKKENSKKFARQLPENFCVQSHHRQKAVENDWPDPDGELEAFRDHHMANGNRMADWDRAFYSWLRRAKKFNTPRGFKHETGKRTDNSKSAMVWQECQVGAFAGTAYANRHPGEDPSPTN